MKVIKITEDEPEKGQCSLECEFTEEEVSFFIEYAVNDILKKQIERMQNELRTNGDKSI
jgi:hypothetical protein